MIGASKQMTGSSLVGLKSVQWTVVFHPQKPVKNHRAAVSKKL